MCHTIGQRPGHRHRGNRSSGIGGVSRSIHEIALLDLSKNGGGGGGETEKVLCDSLEPSAEPIGSPTCYKENHSEEACGPRHSRDWVDLANVLDRCFFFIYCIMLIVFLIFTFPLPSGEIERSIFEDDDNPS